MPKVVPMWLVILGFLAVAGGQLETGFRDPQACSPRLPSAFGADVVSPQALKLGMERDAYAMIGEGGEAAPHDDEQEGEPDQGPAAES